jgi:SpoVK/Ycf46/Vps4 family AAA+-type ATPase
MVNAEADIAAVVNAAAMAAIREHLTKGEVERQKTKTEHSDKGMDSKHKL